MPKKRRDEEDFRELGAYLQLAHEALKAASMKASNMYPKKGNARIRRIDAAIGDVERLRYELDTHWTQEVTESMTAETAGPGPIFGGWSDGPREDALKALRAIARESAEARGRSA